MGTGSYQVVISRRAAHHLRRITQSIESDNPARATSYRLELIEKAKGLSLAPHQGSAYQAYPQFYSINHGNYLIIYDIDAIKQRVEVLAFWHGARKPPKL